MSVSIYTSAKNIYTQIARLFPNDNIHEDDIFEWCMDAEINYIADGDLLYKFIDVPVTIDKTLKIGALPCNVRRIIDVYNKEDVPVEYQVTASNHIKVKSNIDTVYLTYLGIPVDEEGVPKILSSHQPALLTFCKMRIVEEKVLRGEMPMGLLQKYEVQFSNQVTALKQAATHKNKEHYDKVEIIRFNMIKKVGQERLFKNMFK